MRTAIKYTVAEKQSARSLRKEHCQCHAHNYQPPTALLLAAGLGKIRDVPEKRLAEIGVRKRKAGTRVNVSKPIHDMLKVRSFG